MLTENQLAKRSMPSPDSGSPNNCDVITIIRDPYNPLGKRFWLNEHGQVTKNGDVRVSLAIAEQRRVPDVETLRDLMEEVSDDSHAALINASFPLIAIGEPFLILSAHEFLMRGIGRYDTAQKWPVEIEHDGKIYPALGRFKEHYFPTTWLLLDRDIDEYTPPEFANLAYEEWLTAVDRLIPGILQCARLRVHSSSARVCYEGQPQGGGNGHTWVQVADPSDLERVRKTLPARALELGMAWEKPKKSRTTGEVVGRSFATILDWSVFTTGRLVFSGKPEVVNV